MYFIIDSLWKIYWEPCDAQSFHRSIAKIFLESLAGNWSHLDPWKKFLPEVILVIFYRVECWGLDLCIICSSNTQTQICVCVPVLFWKKLLCPCRGGQAIHWFQRLLIILLECFLSFLLEEVLDVHIETFCPAFLGYRCGHVNKFWLIGYE